MQLILITHRFCMCEFAYSVTFFGNLQINTLSSFTIIGRHAQNSKTFDVVQHTIPGEVQQGNTLPSFFSSYPVSKCPFHSLFGAIFFTFLCFYWWFHCLKWPPSILLKFCLMVQGARRQCYALWRKYICQINFFLTRVIVLLAVCSMFNESTIDIK